MEYTTTIVYGKGYTATVYKPILSPEERARREEEVKKAMIEMKKEMMRNANNKGENQNARRMA